MPETVKSSNLVAAVFRALIRIVSSPIRYAINLINNAKKRAARRSVLKKIIRKVPIKQNRRLLDHAVINFGDGYCVGIPSVDNEHKFIMMLYNSLVGDAMALRLNPSRPALLAEKLGKLVSMIGDHFSEEERLMSAVGYDKIIQHKKHHDKFMTDILTITDDIKGLKSEYDQMIFYIGAWFSGHELLSDRDFGDFYRNKSITAETVD